MNQVGIASIKSWEKCKLKAYKDGGGVWTIGWGSIHYKDGSEVKEGDVITQEQADELLFDHCGKMDAKIRASIKFPDLLSENQMGAICSWTYNIGNSAEAHSTLIKKLNLLSPLVGGINQFTAIGDLFLAWDKDNGVEVAGLLNRRKAERELFLKDVA